jgi:hypothetical protein
MHAVVAGDCDKVKVPSSINDALRSIVDLIVTEYVRSWYNQMTSDTDLVEDTEYALKHVIAALLTRFRHFDVEKWVCTRAIPLVTEHLELYIEADALLKQGQANGGPDATAGKGGRGAEGAAVMAIGSETVDLALLLRRGGHHVGLEREGAYFTHVLDKVLPKIMPTALLRSKVQYRFFRECILSIVVRPVVELACSRHFINTTLADALGPALARSTVLGSAGGAAAAVLPREVLLLNHISPSTHQRNVSAFQVTLQQILDDPTGLLQPFQKYLQEYNHIEELMCYRELDELIKIELDGGGALSKDTAWNVEYRQRAKKIYSTLLDPAIKCVELPGSVVNPVRVAFFSSPLSYFNASQPASARDGIYC